MREICAVIAGSITIVIVTATFQGCSPVNFNPLPSLVGPAPGNTGYNSGITQRSLKSIRPTLAVRGMNCLACHGVIGSNVISDFGYGTANFSPPKNPYFFDTPSLPFSGQTAFNNKGFPWQSLTVVNGSLYVPNIPLTSEQASIMFGVNIKGATNFADVLQMPNLGAVPNPSMISGITPPQGKPALVVGSSIKISYPSEGEIVALLPWSLQYAKVAVAAINVPGVLPSRFSGFAPDVLGTFVRNALTDAVECFGDVVVKGPLFLKNLRLKTNNDGCRLYVSGTVFIQGPIIYEGDNASNLQISSARAIIMGFSAKQMGALQNPPAAGVRSLIRIAQQYDSKMTSPGGGAARFSVDSDLLYSPGESLINGVSTLTFFDQIVMDALQIGGELLDAGDLLATQNLVAGETLTGDLRVSINYQGLLLNAPHVHGRYGGKFRGVIISDVAMLARNKSNTTTIEEFAYDPLFDTLSTVLPALTTDILDWQP